MFGYQGGRREATGRQGEVTVRQQGCNQEATGRPQGGNWEAAGKQQGGMGEASRRQQRGSREAGGGSKEATGKQLLSQMSGRGKSEPRRLPEVRAPSAS